MKSDEEAEMMHQVEIKMERWRKAVKKQLGPSKEPKRGQVYESPGGMQFKVTGCTQKEVTVDVDRTVRKNNKRIVETRTRLVPRALFDSFARAYKLVS